MADIAITFPTFSPQTTMWAEVDQLMWDWQDWLQYAQNQCVSPGRGRTCAKWLLDVPEATQEWSASKADYNRMDAIVVAARATDTDGATTYSRVQPVAWRALQRLYNLFRKNGIRRAPPRSMRLGPETYLERGDQEDWQNLSSERSTAMLGHLNGLARMGEEGPSWLSQAGGIVTGLATQARGAYTDFLRSQQGQLPAPQGQQQMPPPQRSTDWSKVLLYGGIAVGGVAGVMWLMKRRKRR